MIAAAQEEGEPHQRDRERNDGRRGAACHAQLRQAEPAANEGRRQHQPDRRRQREGAQRRARIAHAAHHRRSQQVDEQARHGIEHDAGVERGVLQDVGRRAEPPQQRVSERATQQRHRQAHDEAHGERGAGNSLDRLGLLGAPRLPDQHRRTGPQPDDEGDEEEQDREERRHRGECLHAQHVAHIDVVERARQRLQDVGQDQRAEKCNECSPQRASSRRCHAASC